MSLYPPASPEGVPLLSPPSALLDAHRQPMPLALAPRLVDVLANYCVRGVPGWDMLNESDIEITSMKKGMTNQLFIAQRKRHHNERQQSANTSTNHHHEPLQQTQTESRIRDISHTIDPSSSLSSAQPDASPKPTYEKVVIRVFGHDTSTFFDREYEEYITRRLSRRGIGSRILTEFGSGRIEAFLEGRTLECDDLSDPRISYLCAKALAALHSKHIPINAHLIERAKLNVKQDAAKLLPVDPVERVRALSMSKPNTEDDTLANQSSPTGSMRQSFEQSISLVASFDPLSTPNSPIPPVAHLSHRSKDDSDSMSSADRSQQPVDVALNNSEEYMEPLLYFRMRHWFSVARQLSFEDSSKQSIFELLDLTSDRMSCEVEWLCDKLISLNSPIVFCHNDLQEGNLILDTATKPSRKQSAEILSQSTHTKRSHSSSQSHIHHHDKRSLVIDVSDRPVAETPLTSNVSFNSLHRVMSSPHSPTSNHFPKLDRDAHSLYGHWRLYMIDFEYSSYNPRGFDLANHFCEHGIDYNCSEWPGFIIHGFPPNIPDKTHVLRFLETYLTHFKRASRDNSPVAEQEIRDLTRESLWFTLASHFKWAMWGIIQAARSQIHFGYMEYAKQRLDCYQLAKAQLIDWEKQGTEWPTQ